MFNMKKDLLDKLEKENKQEINIFKLETSSTLEEMISKFKKYMHSYVNLDWHRLYSKAESNIPKKYTAEDITYFSMHLQHLETAKYDFEYCAGFYLSALINHCQNYILSIYNLCKINCVGYHNNGKTIIIEGNGGNFLGEKMSSGGIIVDGHVDYGAGSHLNGGKITINGYANGDLGVYMENGEIIINGNAGFLVGSCTEGGMIKINGDYKSLGNNIFATVYHNNKLIAKEGEFYNDLF